MLASVRSGYIFPLGVDYLRLCDSGALLGLGSVRGCGGLRLGDDDVFKLDVFAVLTGEDFATAWFGLLFRSLLFTVFAV